MIDIKTLEVAGINSAIHAMRNPLDSWAKSDTTDGAVGEKDKALSNKLALAGTEHCKHLRLIVAWADITAPFYWWKEFDTYRAGVEKVSCSTMHTITKKPFSQEMFSGEVDPSTIGWLETQRQSYLTAELENWKKLYWRKIIENLPSGFLQMRTVMFSYAALRQICKQRKGHKLTEWHEFRDWCKTLPESWMIIDEDD